jgi:hypothetical protein
MRCWVGVNVCRRGLGGTEVGEEDEGCGKTLKVRRLGWLVRFDTHLIQPLYWIATGRHPCFHSL